MTELHEFGVWLQAQTLDGLRTFALVAFIACPLVAALLVAQRLAVWRVPGERMKAGKTHEVPLSSQAVGILEDAASRANPSGLVFGTRFHQGMDKSALSKLMLRLELGGTVHGWRAAFTDWALENHPDMALAADRALAHGEVSRTGPHTGARHCMTPGWA